MLTTRLDRLQLWKHSVFDIFPLRGAAFAARFEEGRTRQVDSHADLPLEYRSFMPILDIG